MNVEFKGTRGNWKYEHRVIDHEGNYVTQVFSNNTIICDMHWTGEIVGKVNYSRRKENAELISAAPNLLEALQDLVKFCEDNNIGAELSLSHQAINKALGND